MIHGLVWDGVEWRMSKEDTPDLTPKNGTSKSRPQAELRKSFVNQSWKGNAYVTDSTSPKSKKIKECLVGRLNLTSEMVSAKISTSSSLAAILNSVLDILIFCNFSRKKKIFVGEKIHFESF